MFKLFDARGVECALVRASLAALFCAAALSGCGGGGGGGDEGGDGGDPALQITADADSFQMVGIAPGPTTSTPVVFTMSGGSGTYYADATTDMSGITASVSVESETSATVTLIDAIPSDAPGRRTGSITFRLCTDETCQHVAWSHRYPVSYSRFSIDGSSLTMTGSEGAETSTTLTVTPPDTDQLLTMRSDTGWLSSAHDNDGNIVVTASAQSLEAGSYSAYLDAGFGSMGLVSMSVSFNVGTGIIAPALADIVERVDSTAASLHGSALLDFAAPGRAWSATSDQPWLVIDTPSGTGASNVSYHVDPALADAAIANWDQSTATITWKSDGLTDASSTLTYRRQLPEVTIVAPSQVWPDQPATVRVVGRGLSQLSTIGQIRVGGVPVQSGTIDSDTRATLHLPAHAAGSLQVSVANTLTVTGAQANLAVAAGRLDYAALPTTGPKNAIVYDPSRRAVYAANYDGSTLMRWKLSGGTWGLSTVPWAGIWRVQLSPDRRTLFVLDKSSLSEVDPETLTTRLTHVGWEWSGFNFDGPMPVTSDLRMWLPQSGTQYFDLRRHVFAYAPSEQFPGVGLDTMTATPDGTHLFSVNGSTSPAPPDGWYSSETQTNSPLPSSVLERAYRASFNLAGDLGLFNWQSVYRTGTWTLVGEAVLPDDESGCGGVISPDGTRVYRLSGPNSGMFCTPDRVDVFDTTQLQPGTSRFVMIGKISVPDPATSCDEPECDPPGRLEIDPLGSNLFWVGNQKFVVMPIPAGMAGTLGTKAPGSRLQRAVPGTTARH